jgi:hypothetical protein
MANARPDPTSSDTRCHFFKVPLELRDNIYDYVAYGEQNLGLHVNLEVATEPKLHAYDKGLSQTCSQIRQEHSIRLQRHIKQLAIDHEASGPERGTASFSRRLKGHCVLIAESKVSKGVWNQDGFALEMFLPFRGMFDEGKVNSTLIFTVASSAARAHNRRFPLKFAREPRTRKRPLSELIDAVRRLSALKVVTATDARNWWSLLWREHVWLRMTYTDSQDATSPSYAGLPFWWVSLSASLRPTDIRFDCESDDDGHRRSERQYRKLV